MRTLACLTIAGFAMVTTTLPLTTASADEELKGAPIKARTDGHAPDTYRYGLMLGIAEADDADACEQACTEASYCAAWSLIPASADAGPRCELKQSIGRAISRPGAVSGIAVRFHPVAVQPEPDDAPSAPSIKSKPAKAKPSEKMSVAASASASNPVVYRPGDTAGLDGAPAKSGTTKVTSATGNAPVVLKPGN